MVLHQNFSDENYPKNLLKIEQAFIMGGYAVAFMNSKKMFTVTKPQGCCLRCGRTEEVGSVNIDQCADCVAMNFNID